VQATAEIAGTTDKFEWYPGPRAITGATGARAAVTAVLASKSNRATAIRTPHTIPATTTAIIQIEASVTSNTKREFSSLPRRP